MSLLITSTNKKVKLISKIASDLTQLQNSKYLQYALEKLISLNLITKRGLRK